MIGKVTNWVLLSLATFMVTLSLISGCGSGGGGWGPPNVGAGPIMLFESSASIRLGWNQVTTNIDGGTTYIAQYNVYIRVHDTINWSFLDFVPDSAAPWMEIYHSYDGKFDFAVSAVDYNGQESTKATSLDENAIPQGGWYLLWQRTGNPPPMAPSGVEKKS